MTRNYFKVKTIDSLSLAGGSPTEGFCVEPNMKGPSFVYFFFILTNCNQMSQFNSIFSPLSNKLARLAGITLLAVAALFASTQQMSAQACVQNLSISLDENCEVSVPVSMVLLGGTASDYYLKINDNNPGDDNASTGEGLVNQVSPASGWTYGVFKKSNNALQCQGTIVVIDDFAPVFNAGAEAHWAKIDTIITWADNLDDIYNNVASWGTTTTTNTWGGSLPTGASPQFYTGRPWMADPCEQIQQGKGGGADNIRELAADTWLGIRTAVDNLPVTADDNSGANAWPDLATNAVQIKVTDYLESPQCDSQALGFHYKLRRTFQMVDKRGNDTTLNQIIYFQRPQTRGTAGATPLANTNTKATSWLSKGPGNLGQFGPFGNNPKRARLDYGSVNNFTVANRVTPNSTFTKYGVDSMAASNGGRYSEFIDTVAFNLTNGGCVAAPATKAEVEVVLRNLYVAIDTTAVGAQDSLSLFDPEFSQRNNYSVSFTYDGAEFPACDKGKKFQVVTSVFDWCSSTIEKDTVILKFEDKSVPEFSALTAGVGGIKGATEAARITISVNTNDCSGSLRLPVKSELTRGTGFERDLGSLFNWTVNDGCSGKAVRLNYKFETRDEYNNGYYLDRTDYLGRNYTVAEMNGGPVALGLPVGEHRLIIEAWDNCSNETTDTLWFIVNDRVAPVMKCDDQLNVTLTSNSTSNYFLNLNASNKERTNDQYARLTVADINEGSRDNCTLDSMFVRRVVSKECIENYLSWNMDYDIHGNNDGVVTLGDFDLIETGDNKGSYYTPRHMQYVEFYCCDGGANNSGLPNSPMVELWGSDVEQPIFGPTGNNILTTNPVPSSNLNRNWSFCWGTVNIEDKTPPTITAPLLSKHYNAEATNWINCTDKELIGDPTVNLPLTLVTDLADDTYTTANGKIATRGFANTRFGTPDIFGIECNGTVKYGVIKKLTCDTGIILRHWEVTKIIKSSPLTQIVVRDTQLIYVQASHDYTIQVPADVTTSECASTPTSTLTFDEDGCDLLAISKVEDKVYQAGAADGACKKVYRTWTVINWCQLPNQFVCSNADPLTFARVIPRLKSASTVADVNGIAVAAQHRFVKRNTNTTRAKGGDVTNHGSLYSRWISNPVTTTGDNWTATAVSGATTTQHRIGTTTATGAFTPASGAGSYGLSNYGPLNVNPAGCGTGEQTFAWQYTQVIKIQDLTAPTIVGAADGGPARRFTPVDAASDDVNWVAAWNPSNYQSGLTYAESKRFTAAREVFGIRGRMVTGDNGSSTSYSAVPPSCHALVKFTFDVKDGCTASGPFAVDNAVVVFKKSVLQTTAIANANGKSFSWIGGNQVADATSNIKVSPVDYGSQTTPTGTNPTTFAVEIDNLPIDQTGGDGFVGYEEYQLLVTIRDDCGNVRVDRIDFTVADVKAPAPVCVQILKATIMPADASANKGMVVIRAVDVFQDIYRNWAAEECTGTPKATIQLLNANGVPTGVRGETVTVTCDNLAGVQARVYLQDAAGNQDYCTVTINVEDNNSICGAAGSAAVAGAIQTESKATVEGVQVNLSGQTQKSFATGVNGLFVFNNLAAGADYTVTPSLNKGFLNGVSTFDLVLISKHILGVQPLNTPYKLIAADVNNSKSVTTLDLIQLRKLILNIDATFANNSSWRFVDASYTFPNASNPWAASFPEVKNVNDLVGSLSANFVAVKVGDVNGNAIANSTQGSVRNLTSNLGINVADMNMVAGNEYKVDFTAADLNGIEGFQFTLNLDKKGLELVDLVPGIAAEENFGIFAEEGVVTASWNGEAKGGVLFSLVVRAKSNTTLSEVLNLNSRYTAAEAYKGGEVVNVGLNFNASKASANYELYQNTPNPFAGESIIGFNLPAAGAATLTIQDVTGRTLKVINGQYAKGYNQVSLKSTELSATGVLTYTLKAADFTATRKMIIVE
jgi:hypothetical protein